jgi:hypothetical protein
VADKQHLLSVEQYKDELAKINFDISKHVGKASCYAVAKDIDTTVQRLGSTVYYASNYSKKSIVEHKAELPITEPSEYQVFLNENLPRIKEQFVYGVANMYEWSPRITRYIIDLAERPNTQPVSDAEIYSLTRRNFTQTSCAWYEQHPEVMTDTVVG